MEERARLARPQHDRGKVWQAAARGGRGSNIVQGGDAQKSCTHPPTRFQAQLAVFRVGFRRGPKIAGAAPCGGAACRESARGGHPTSSAVVGLAGLPHLALLFSCIKHEAVLVHERHERAARIERPFRRQGSAGPSARPHKPFPCWGGKNRDQGIDDPVPVSRGPFSGHLCPGW